MSGMSLWTVSIKKQWIDEVWDNVYVVQASSLSAATGIGNTIVGIERAVHTADVLFLSYETRPILIGAGGGTVTALSGAGNRTAAASGTTLPFFNTVRVTFKPAAGKPSQKYLRTPLAEAEQRNGDLESAFITTVQTAYLNPMLAVTGFCDPQGQTFVSGSVYPRVQMRQLKRKRRSRAGFKRGWVPA